MSEFAPPTKESYAGPANTAADGVTPILPAHLQAVKGDVLPMPIANPLDLQTELPQYDEPNLEKNNEMATKRGRVRQFVGRLTSRGKASSSEVSETVAPDVEAIDPWESMPTEYDRAWNKNDVSTLPGLIERFRSDAAWNPNVAHTLKNAYSVVRNIGDALLISNDPTGEVSAILDATRSQARPRTFSEIARDDETLAIHSETRQEMGIHNSNLLLDTKFLETYLRKSGVELKKPSDSLLFTTINTAAHESGHAILSGVSKLMISTSSLNNPTNRLAQDARAIATRTYLAAHPEEALTGNWNTDVVTQEERFAEGFGNAVLGKVMDTLGYDDKEKATIISHFLDKAGLRSDIIGQHPIDLLDKFSADRGIKEVGHEVGVEMSAGAIGYSMPLSVEKIASQLSELSRLIKSRPADGYVTNVDRYTWEEKVKTGQSEQTKAEIAAQWAQRATDVLNK